MAEMGEGTGATIAFATSGFTGYWIEIDTPDDSRNRIDTTHLGTTVRKTSIPCALREDSSARGLLIWDPSWGTAPPINSEASETITITLPNYTDATLFQGETIIFDGYIESLGGVPLRVGELATMEVNLVCTSAISGTSYYDGT